MKQQLRQIYDDLSSGKVSQQEALERIKAVKAHDFGASDGVLLATPVWVVRDVEPLRDTTPLADASHDVLVCGLSQVDAARVAAVVPHSQCAAVHADAATPAREDGDAAVAGVAR